VPSEPATDNPTVLFEIDEVTLRRAGVPVLERFSARIDSGATAIVGPSGVGKSSLLRLLNRLADPDSGQISYRGTPLTELDVLALRREVMLVPQLPALIAGSVADNLEYARRLSCRERIDPAAALAGAGLDGSYLDRDAARLSVGEQQRAMLARALAVEPAVLLLDEPTSALDAEATAAIEAALLKLGRSGSLSIVLVTHDSAQADRLTSRRIELRPAAAPSPDPAQAGP
jgi:putative ABC transport system ATP-binding protein